MTETILKAGKNVPITITPEIRKHIELYKKRLQEMADQPDETSEFDRITIDIIINKLCDYDRNIICAYYTIAECSPTKLARLLGSSQSVISHKVKKIHKLITELNDTPKTHYNNPRECVDY